jgi:hypothetical protein
MHFPCHVVRAAKVHVPVEGLLQMQQPPAQLLKMQHRARLNAATEHCPKSTSRDLSAER